MLRVLIIVLILFTTAFSAGMEPLNILNFSAVNGANDMIRQDDTLFIATGGGLACFQNSSKNFLALHHSHEQFPEISLSALDVDGGGLWIGSENGYLYYRQKSKRQRIYDDLFVVKSQIYQIKSYENYLIIAHSNGVSIFDKKIGKIVSTKQNFAGLANSSVNLIKIENATLFLAVKSEAYSGVIRLDDFEKYLGDARMNDYSPLAAQIPWKVELTQEEDIRTLYVNGDGKISTSNKILIFGDDYIIEREYEWTNWLRKTDNSGNRIDSRDLGSEITFVKFIDGKIAVGTKYDFAYFWDENLDRSNYTQFVVPGLRINTEISKLFVDSKNSLWVLPAIKRNSEFCERSILAEIKQNRAINHYGQSDYGFGYTDCDGAVWFTGVVESDSKMFFGFGGDALREFDKNTNLWGRWLVNYDMNATSAQFTQEDVGRPDWIKIDNILEIDGLIYGTYFRDFDATNPVMFELNPRSKAFRNLLVNGDGKKMPNGLIKTTDGMFLSFRESNELWRLNEKNYDSIADKIKIGGSRTPTKIEKTGTGNIIIGTTGAPLIVYGNSTKNIEHIPNRFDGITDIVFEYSEELWSENENQTQTRSVFWIATSNSVERVVIDEYVTRNNGPLVLAVYDTTQTAFALTTENGGVNSNISALAIDKAQNLLWIGGDNGITRIRLPERTSISANKKVDYLFPNPFVLNRNTVLSIPAPQNSFIDIYTVSGKLVKHIDESTAERTKTIDGSFMYKWRIPQNFAPGTYIVAVKPLEGDKTDGKNTKQYKLVVIK